MIYVVLQFICIIFLIINADFAQFSTLNWLLFALSTIIACWAVFNMRLDNLNILPKLKTNHKLITSGIYSHIRHPIYTAIIIGTLALVLSRPQIVQWLAWLMLIVILILKSNKEEWYLSRRFSDYQTYKKRAGKFLPFL